VTELPAIRGTSPSTAVSGADAPAATLGALPGEVVGQFGPQLTALIAHLTLPRLVMQQLCLEGALQIPFGE
jgi:hypothetical protein